LLTGQIAAHGANQLLVTAICGLDTSIQVRVFKVNTRETITISRVG
jgi:hypothetical protein